MYGSTIQPFNSTKASIIGQGIANLLADGTEASQISIQDQGDLAAVSTPASRTHVSLPVVGGRSATFSLACELQGCRPSGHPTLAAEWCQGLLLEMLSQLPRLKQAFRK